MAENTTDFIPCMLVPLKDHYLLLPNSTIAEVIPMPRVSEVSDKAEFWVGLCKWHDLQVPVIDLESLVSNSKSDSEQAHKLCVLYGINDSVAMNVYALPCYGVPQLIHINESALTLAADEEESEFLHYQIKIGNKVAYIPNLDKIEASIEQ
ncbi:MAG: hypothetical protein COA90_03180 [Gammaproteobacteria bacterium]|nr:MAG: hypothetical protein COA90_03180 [Gammaproteobacteria bacterium]